MTAPISVDPGVTNKEAESSKGVFRAQFEFPEDDTKEDGKVEVVPTTFAKELIATNENEVN